MYNTDELNTLSQNIAQLEQRENCGENFLATNYTLEEIIWVDFMKEYDSAIQGQVIGMDLTADGVRYDIMLFIGDDETTDIYSVDPAYISKTYRS